MRKNKYSRLRKLLWANATISTHPGEVVIWISDDVRVELFELLEDIAYRGPSPFFQRVK